MSEWWRHLRGKPFYWVLDGSNPAADLFMLRYVLERPEQARALRAAQLRLRESPEVEALKEQLAMEGGLWAPRYHTSLWVLRLLAELDVPGDDERIAEALDRVLDQGEDVEGVSSPINANAIVVHMAAVFGFHRDGRVQARLARLEERLEACDLPDQADAAVDWLTQSAMALAALPEEARDAATVERLAHRLEALDPAPIQRYRQYGFPTFDRPDDLTLARSALLLNVGRAWLEPWVRYIEGAQDEQGLWRMQRYLPTPGAVRWEDEEEGEPSRWLSAQALYILRAYYGE
ncbi:MAG: hypothetical protein M3220_10900 [Chloroflexota bacterium]|nr:hypothetical protein [Chloroflexota bacterium]